MEPLTLVLLILIGFVLFDVVAVELGQDSRPSIGDDHARPTYQE